MPVLYSAPLPPEPQKRWHKVISPKGKVPIDCVILSTEFFGQWTHWLALSARDGITVPCTHDEDCARCKAGLPSRWKGFLAVLLSDKKEERVLELTDGAARALLPYLENYGTLRGLQAVFVRAHSNKPNAPVIVKIVGDVDEARLPAAFSVHDSLSRLWGVNEEFFARGGKRHNAPPKFRGAEGNQDVPV